MKFTEEQRKVFKELNDKMLAATSPDEVEYYSKQIHELLDRIEDVGPVSKISMSKEDRDEYELLIVHLREATNSKEVLYYENKINELLDKVAGK